jgi:hypothetical protein
MWVCPACAESLDEEFDTCWKCGTDRAGGKSAEFVIDEPVEDRGQDAESADDHPGRQIQLPDITYYSIPIWCCWAAVQISTQRFNYVQGADGRLPPLALNLLVMTAFILVIGLPLLIATLRIFHDRKHDPLRPWLLREISWACCGLPRRFGAGIAGSV